MKSTIFSLYVWALWLTVTVICTPFLLVLLAISPQWALAFLRFVSRFALGGAGIRVKVAGAENIDPRKAYLYIGNHQSQIEPFLMAAALPQFAVGIEKASNFKIPFYGWIIRRWGQIPIVREDPVKAREAIAQAIARYQRGVSVSILPEGTRSSQATMGPFKKGAFHLAIDTGATIIPFAFCDGWWIIVKGGWKVRPCDVTVAYGEPIDISNYTKDHLDELMELVRSRIQALLDTHQQHW